MKKKNIKYILSLESRVELLEKKLDIVQDYIEDTLNTAIKLSVKFDKKSVLDELAN